MKNLTIGTKEKKALLYVFGLLLALGVYQFFFTSMLDKNEAISTENTQLERDVAKLKELDANKEQYQMKTNAMEKDLADLYAQFPAGVQEEDAIMYAKSLQDLGDIKVSAVTLAEPILAYTVGQGTETADGTQENTAASATATAAPTSTPAADGTTTDGATADGTTADAGTGAPQEAQKLLYYVPATLDYTITYSKLKACLLAIKGSADRKVVDSITLSYDATSGKILGTMNMNLYYMTGTNSIYSEPAIPDVKSGTTNIFGSK